MDLNALLNMTAVSGSIPASPFDASLPDASIASVIPGEDMAFSDQLLGLPADSGDDLPALPDAAARAAGDLPETDPITDMIAALTGIATAIPAPSGMHSLPENPSGQWEEPQPTADMQDGNTLHLKQFQARSAGVATDHLPAIAAEGAQPRAPDNAAARIATPPADEAASLVPKAKDPPPGTVTATGISRHPKPKDRDTILAQAPRNIPAEFASPSSENIRPTGAPSQAHTPLPPVGSAPTLPIEPASGAAAMPGNFEFQGDALGNPPRLTPGDGLSANTGISPQVEARGTSPNTPSVIRQIADAVVTTRNDSVEITLSPEELGKVRMILTGHERAPHLAIWAERPEILEQLRRNADLLMQQFSEEGMPDATLSFQDHRQRGDADQMNGDQPSGNEDNPSHASAGPITGGSLAPETPIASGTRRIDVRM
ncbi:flagellar hook-length control protein FliK [Paracoccus onubensis]|uniref:flagellar hook-length control protein FliK n=1 Tax=Paracoccus onubensis TaxID=1675788 RepID=UPI00272FC6B8|nr:flagellar hook-length control protein FliK [Paracoccus onubensis]MDP0927890.1 flagellar hook-length control protein FliK [Paracoccus onubensis]